MLRSDSLKRCSCPSWLSSLHTDAGPATSAWPASPRTYRIRRWQCWQCARSSLPSPSGYSEVAALPPLPPPNPPPPPMAAPPAGVRGAGGTAGEPPFMGFSAVHSFWCLGSASSLHTAWHEPAPRVDGQGAWRK